MKLGQIAEKLGCTLEGDANLEITGVAGIEDARSGELTFLANRKYRPALETTHASAILIAQDAAADPKRSPLRMAALRSQNPYLDFARAIELFHPAPQFVPGVHATAVVAKSAKIGANAHIGPYCFVDENVEIGRNAVLARLSPEPGKHGSRLRRLGGRRLSPGAYFVTIVGAGDFPGTGAGDSSGTDAWSGTWTPADTARLSSS